MWTEPQLTILQKVNRWVVWLSIKISEETLLELNRFMDTDYIDKILNNLKEEEPNFANLQRGIDLLLKHLYSQSRIAVLFDVDMDGICSGSIIYDYIKCISIAPLALINERKNHGITKNVISECLVNKINLLICVDCASNDINYLKILDSYSIDVLILDHHEVDNKKLFSVINPVLISASDGQYRNKNLSGAGVVYKFVKELDSKIKSYDTNKYLEFAGISIISDMCNMLERENRWFVHQLLVETDKFSKFTSMFVEYGAVKNAFVFGCIPVVNSLIRLGFSQLAKNVFIAYSSSEIRRIYEIGLITREFQEKSIKLLLDEIKHNKDVIFRDYGSLLFLNISCFLKKENERLKASIGELGKKLNTELSYSSIISNFTGLLASKFKEIYSKPTLVAYRINDDGEVRGSFRGNNQRINYKDIFNNCGVKSLGHQQAFGLVSNIAEYNEGIKLIIDELSKDTLADSVYVLDCDINKVNLRIIRDIALLNEFSGVGVKEIFVRLHFNTYDISIDNKEKYDIITIKNFEILNFNKNAKFNELRKVKKCLVEPTFDKCNDVGFKLIFKE